MPILDHVCAGCYVGAVEEPKIIKRYANRKLYDTERSCYVTLEDIAGMIRSGEEVRVIDNKSGEDLTTVTFAQIIFETEKRESVMPLSLLRELVVSGGDVVGDFARGRVERVQARANEFVDSAQKIKEGLGDKLERSIDDLQRGVEDHVKHKMDIVQRKAQIGRFFDDIKQRISEFESRISK